MLYSLAARVVVMVVDHGVSIDEAVAWVLRRMPAGLREYYTLLVSYAAALELDDAILLTDEV